MPGSRGALPNSPGIRACSCCRARPPSATSAQQHRARRADHGPSARTSGPARSRSGSGSCAPARSCSRPGRSSSRSYFRATTDPGSCWRARRRRISIATACARARARAVVTVTDGAYRTALDLRAAGVEIAAIVDQRPGSAMADAARQRRHRGHRRRDGRRQRAGHCCVAGDRARRPDARLRPRPDVGRLGAVRAPVLAVARAAHLERCRARVRAVGIGRTRALGRGLPRRLRPCGSACGRRGGGRRGGRRRAVTQASRSGSAVSGDEPSVTGSAHGRLAAREPGQEGLRVDFQNDVTARDLAARRAGRIPLDRAREALHDGRHGDGPGQDVEPQCARHRRRDTRASRSRKSGTRLSGCRIRPCHSAASRAWRAAISSTRCGRRRCTSCGCTRAPCSRTSASGSARATSRRAARTSMLRSRASAAPCARLAAYSTPRRSARSR